MLSVLKIINAKTHRKTVLWDFVGFGVEALAGSRECVPAEASTPPEFLKTQKNLRVLCALCGDYLSG